MQSKFRFDPLGATKSAQRNSNSYTVVWRQGDIHLGLVRKTSDGWTGLYAYRNPSPNLSSKDKVADWMLERYEESLSG